jgi:hypothetical protein
MEKIRTFVDTNVIIEAFRIKCWSAIAGQFSLETVQECVTEARTGDQGNATRTNIPDDEFKNGLTKTHDVSKKERANIIEYPSCRGLDPGEQCLFAYLLAHYHELPNVIFVSTADKAAIAASLKLPFFDKLTSLETLAKIAGVNKAKLGTLAPAYREDFLSKIKSQAILGIIP